MTKKSVLICTPCKGGFVHVNYMMSLMHSLQILSAKGIAFALLFDVGKSGIDLPRSMAATHFLESEYTHLMFVDDDMAWQPEIIARMIEFDVDIVGVPYRQKEKTVIYNMRVKADEFDQSTENPSLIKVHDIATGLLLVKRCVFETLKDKVEVILDHGTQKNISMFFRHMVVKDPIACPNGENAFMSEDLYFCRIAREAGFQIWSYVDVETGHTGTTTYKGNYANVLEEVTKEKFRDCIVKQPLALTGSVDE